MNLSTPSQGRMNTLVEMNARVVSLATYNNNPDNYPLWSPVMRIFRSGWWVSGWQVWEWIWCDIMCVLRIVTVISLPPFDHPLTLPWHPLLLPKDRTCGCFSCQAVSESPWTGPKTNHESEGWDLSVYNVKVAWHMYKCVFVWWTQISFYLFY